MDTRGRLNEEDRDNLRAFAQRVERHIVKAGGPEAMERLICRLLNNKKQPQVAGSVAGKWVEWRYGKAKETLQIEGHIEHTVFDASKLTDEQLAQAEQLVESASSGSDQG
jgi:hypothetical protein